MFKKSAAAKRRKAEEKLDQAEKDGELELDYEDVTGLIDLVTERTKSIAEHCQKQVRDTADEIRKLTPVPRKA